MSWPNRNGPAGLAVSEAANGKQGIAVLVAGVVVVANTSVTANSRIFCATQSVAGVTLPQGLGISARTPGVSFTISSSNAADTSTVAWEMFEPG